MVKILKRGQGKYVREEKRKKKEKGNGEQKGEKNKEASG